MAVKYQPPAAAVRERQEHQLPAAGGGSEVDVQIATAKRYPRNVQVSLEKARQLATMSEEVAEECHYSIPRAGKQIEGPSVRLAEIVASTWGNLRFGSRIIAIEEREVVVEGAAFDLENNVAVSKQVRRRITRKDGSRFDDDMIQVTANAASSIAVRNAIFQIIPKPFWQTVVDATNEVIHQGKKPIAQRRQAALAWFAARGVEAGQVLSLLGKKNEGEIGIEEIRELLGIRNAITEGTSSIAEIFGPGAEAAPGVKRSLNLRKPAPEGGPEGAGGISSPVSPSGPGHLPEPDGSLAAGGRGLKPESDEDPFSSVRPADGSPPAPPASSTHAGGGPPSPPSPASTSPTTAPGEQPALTPPPASSLPDEPETGPEGGIVLPPERSAKDELRRLTLDLANRNVPKARAICRRVSIGKWDSPNHPACTEKEAASVLEQLREEWLEKRGGQLGREPGSDG